MLLEIHCHSSRHSACSHAGPLDLIRRVRARGLQGIIFTEHHYLWTEEELEDLRPRAEVDDAFLIMAGQEVQTDIGHVLVYGAPETIGEPTPVEEIRRKYPECALVLAHPYRDGRKVISPLLLDRRLDGIEIFSNNQTVRENCRGLRDWHRYKFTALAGTDTHAAFSAGLYPTQFDHPVSTIAEVILEVKKGRCRPFFKEIPKAGSKLELTEIVIGTKGEIEYRPRIIFKKFASRGKWKRAVRAFTIMKEIYEHGFDRGTYRVPTPIDKEAESLTLIEEGMRGKTLFDKLKAAGTAEGREYIELSAYWLARLHNLRLRITPLGDFIAKENRRLRRYIERFETAGLDTAKRVERLAARIHSHETMIMGKDALALVQGHGDFHPKNIHLGQYREEDRLSRFVAAIDFESSHVLPRAFDVGSFIAQFLSQFAACPAVLEKYPTDIFLDSYIDHSDDLPADFARQVPVFRARTNLSIAAYLVKVGKGESGKIRGILEGAEKALADL